MLVSLSDMKTYLNIPTLTTTYDAFLTQQLTLVSDMVEAYCGRKFQSATYIQTLYSEDYLGEMQNKLMLYHFPVKTIASVNIDTSPVTDYKVAKEYGIISKQYGFFGSGKELVVTYDAGYDVIPAPITTGIMSIVEEKYNRHKSGVSLNFGSDIQRVSIPGTISIDFDYTLTSNDRKTKFGIILGNYINLFDAYRSERNIIGSGKLTYVG